MGFPDVDGDGFVDSRASSQDGPAAVTTGGYEYCRAEGTPILCNNGAAQATLSGIQTFCRENVRTCSIFEDLYTPSKLQVEFIVRKQDT